MDSSELLLEKRNLLEMHLKDGMNSYKTLFDCNPDAIFAIDLSGYFVFLNPACEQITGYSKTEISKKKFINLITLEDVSKVTSYYYQALEGSFQNYDCKINHKNGQIIDLNVTNLPIAVNEEIVGVYGVAKDITDIKQKRQKLKDSEELYRILTENSMDMIVKTDKNGIFRYVSPVCEQILGFKPEEITGLSSFDFIHQDDREKYVVNHKGMLRNQGTSLDTYRMRKKDGNYILMESHCSPLLKSSKEIEILSFSRDVTERIRAEEEIKQTQQLLLNSEKLSVAGQLAAGIAHEVRNPLTAIKGFLQLINVEKEQKTYLDIIHSEMNRIEIILSELLIIAKPQVMKFKKTDLKGLLENVKTLIDTQAILNNIQIKLEYSSTIPEVNCDENQLKQVFINFLKNSIEAMPSGGNIIIQVHMQNQNLIKLRFCDTGCGIPKENLKRIGEPFFTTKESGTGLGLLVSKQIIENHKGCIQIDSNQHGTTIEVTLPIS